MKDINYLVFSGGGAAVYGHAGAILELSKQPHFSLSQIKGVAGASVGTIMALLVSLNYPIDRLVAIMESFDISKLADGGLFTQRAYRLFNEYGIHTGDKLYDFILAILREKTGRQDPENITFADLKKEGYKDLYVVATKLYKENGSPMAKEKIFSAEKTPDTSVAAAILASCAAPGFFRRVRLKKISKGKYVLNESGDLYDDGGIVNNFPIDIFDQPQFIPFAELKDMKKIINPHTLGFALLNTSVMNDAKHPVTKTILPDARPLTFGTSLANALTLQFQKNRLEKKHNRTRTVQIDRLKVGLADFSISDKNKLALLESGGQAVRDYFNLGQMEPINDIKFAGKNASFSQFWSSKPKPKVANDEEFEKLMLLSSI